MLTEVGLQPTSDMGGLSLPEVVLRCGHGRRHDIGCAMVRSVDGLVGGPPGASIGVPPGGRSCLYPAEKYDSEPSGYLVRL